MAFDAFIQIEGIPGECTDDKHKNWIEIMSFNHELEQPASATGSSAGGSSSERVNIEALAVSHLVDKSSPKLYEACCKGQIIPKAVIQVCRAGGDKMVYLEITMKQLVISGVKYGGASGENFPSETIRISAGSYVWKYNQQDKANGTVVGSVSRGWALRLNKPTS